jgi:hypothetical protein
MRKKKLEKLFDDSIAVNPTHLLGKNGVQAEWTVRLHTGPVLDLGFLRHRLRFWLEGKSLKKGRVVGCNVTGGDSRWGYFAVFKGVSGTNLDFDEGRNRLARRIYTELRSTSYAYLVVGRLYVRILGKNRFVGYLTLRRRGDRRRAR